jgi:hypothetical protein
LDVVLFRHLDDQVHHIRNAAGALEALSQLAIDHGGHDDLPGVNLEQRQDDLLDFPVGDHIALADEHRRKGPENRGIKPRVNLNVNVRYSRRSGKENPPPLLCVAEAPAT